MPQPPPSDRVELFRRPVPNTGAFLPGVILVERYRIVARVGRGGMGEVFRADDLRLGQPVALKFLPPELEQDDDARERLLAEVRLARTIAHPNVCRVYDIGDLPAEGDVPGLTFLSMEFIDGEDLGSLLRRIGRLSPNKAIDIARQLCAGLAAAHDKGVLHRDLKPANVMIDGRGHARIADFGIAVQASLDVDDTSSDRNVGDNAGTLAYMAPERFAGDPATVQSDLYALGHILYEIVTGVSPFTVSSPREWVSAHLMSAPTNPSALVSDVDPAVERVILRCLEKDPAKRPASAAHVAAALPGGDPLAAALAAGETPSPELVAASGLEGTLPRTQAWAWLATAVLSLAIAVWSMNSELFVNHTPMPFDTGALEHRAHEIAISLGYRTPPADWTSRWTGSGTKEQRLALLYRESPEALFDFPGLNAIDNPTQFPEDLRLKLDARGRLQELDVGGTKPYSDTTGAREVDWAPLLTAIGADAPPVPSASRRWPSAFHSDIRAAWTAMIDGVPSVIEAAALRGRPVSLRIRPVGAPDETQAPPPNTGRGAGYIVIAILVFVPISLGVLARRNMRLGRGDRRGATRLALFILLTLTIYLLLDRHWTRDPGSMVPGVLAGVLAAVVFPLFWAVTMWFAYIAVEPFLRRRWPSLLVAWARVLDGRFRDAFVGQSVLAGIVAGAIGASLVAGNNAVSRAAQDTGYFYRPGWSASAGQISIEVVAGFLFVGLLVLSRMVLRRDWAAWCALGLLLVGTDLSAVPDGKLWIALLFLIVQAALTLGVFFRFGVLALIVTNTVLDTILGSPITLDPSRWYFWRGATVVAVVFALAIWGFMSVLGKQSALPADAMDA